MSRNISENGIAFIEKEEGGCYLTAYHDQKGIPTISVGVIEYPDGTKVKMGDKIDQARADELFKWALAAKVKGVDAATQSINLNANQFDSLVSFTYNEGIGALISSTLLRKIKSGQNNTLKIEDYEDHKVREWFQEHHSDIKAAPELLYWFCVYCKISRPDDTKIFSDGLIMRRWREYKLFNS